MALATSPWAYLEQVVVNFVSYYEAVAKLFIDLGNLCPRFAEYQALYANSARLQKALCNFHASIVRCCKHLVEALQRPCTSALPSRRLPRLGLTIQRATATLPRSLGIIRTGIQPRYRGHPKLQHQCQGRAGPRKGTG